MKKYTFVKLAIKIFILELVENQKFQRYQHHNITSVVLFKKEKNDLENSVVSKLLLHVSGNSLNEKIYICKTCHQNLHTRTGGEPKIPKVPVSKQHSVAQKFLTAIQQKPEFVCTC